MLFQIVLNLLFTVICVSCICDQRCLRQYTRVKRGRFYSYPQKFYNTPPLPIPVSGPYSNTPPPFVNYEPYGGSRPYKVSKRPTSPINDGLADDDITNLVKHLSKQDLDKILEFAQEKDQSYNKYKDIYNTNEYSQPFKRKSKILYKGNKINDESTSYRLHKPLNYVTESNHVNDFSVSETSIPVWINSESNYQKTPFDNDNFIPGKRVLNNNQSPAQNYINSQSSISFFGANRQLTKPTYVQVNSAQETESPISLFGANSPLTKPTYVQVNSAQETQNPISFFGANNQLTKPTYFQINSAQETQIPMQLDIDNNPAVQAYDSQSPVNIPISNNPYFTESDEGKLQRPYNTREEDFEVQYTNNVPKVVPADTSSYDIKDFGDLPLMDYSQSKLEDVSSYHVPHYTVTHPKPPKPAAHSPPVSFSQPSSYSSSTSLLKPSPAAAAIREPIYERAPPLSAAAVQSDAHLKAIKIWSNKSKGAAFTLHDDGTLTPERNRPIYG